ncbi:MAG: radical SAM/SPASM domain-containing protein [Candidatus Hermodarchaeota archaeon]
MESNQKDQKYRKYGFKDYSLWLFPNIVNLCVLRGKCPCKCIHCPVGTISISERLEKFGDECVSLELYEKITNEMRIYPHTTLRIHGVGEPLLWDNLIDALKISKKLGVRTWLFTSLVTSNKEIIKKLVRYCDIIEISVNSRSRGDYFKTKGIDAFEVVCDNIKIMLSEKQEHDWGSRILTSRVESQHIGEDRAFIEYWKDTDIDDSFIRTFHTYNDALENSLNKKAQNSICCLVHWSRFNIDCDGKAVLCFNELFKNKKAPDEMIIGDVTQNSIKYIWQSSDRLNKVRLAQLKQDYGIINFASYIPCIDCVSCQPIDGDRPTSEYQINLLKKSRNKSRN